MSGGTGYLNQNGQIIEFIAQEDATQSLFVNPDGSTATAPDEGFPFAENALVIGVDGGHFYISGGELLPGDPPVLSTSDEFFSQSTSNLLSPDASAPFIEDSFSAVDVGFNSTPIISTDGSSIISQDGGSIISQDGGSIISTDGSSFSGINAFSGDFTSEEHHFEPDAGFTSVGVSSNSPFEHPGNTITLADGSHVSTTDFFGLDV